ncbi:unnamed protein product [Clonostachys rosea f. rosea IK726]|uniref:Uncharacterized protein n=1 Tax=Clonostachys rosea f. rosea IK726 TaxID=1349383 RepID=A0ACA9TX11_BIOOC|nr:unnamed protein product [Clonostachys rosea f. rosea IK726]
MAQTGWIHAAATWIMGGRSLPSNAHGRFGIRGGPKQVGYIQRQPGSWEGGPYRPTIMDGSGPKNLGDNAMAPLPIRALLFSGQRKWF